MLQRIKDWITGTILGVGIMIMIGVYFNMQPKPIETPAPAIVQSDGSQVLERRPDAKAKSPSVIPKGGKVERIIHGEITLNWPKDRPTGVDPANVGGAANCPTCKFDLTLVRMPDDTQRVVLWSETGTVVGGLDVPVALIDVKKRRTMAAGISHGTSEGAWGAWLDRDFGPLRTGFEVNKSDSQYEGRVKIGLMF